MNKFKKSIPIFAGTAFISIYVTLLLYAFSKLFRQNDASSLMSFVKTFNVLCQSSPKTCSDNTEAAFGGLFLTFFLAFIALYYAGEKVALNYLGAQGSKNSKQQHGQNFPLLDQSLKDLEGITKELAKLKLPKDNEEDYNHNSAVELIDKAIERLNFYESRSNALEERLEATLKNMCAYLADIQNAGYEGGNGHNVSWGLFDKFNKNNNAKLNTQQIRVRNWNPGAGSNEHRHQNDYVERSILIQLVHPELRSKAKDNTYENVKPKAHYENVQLKDQEENYSIVSLSI